MATSDADSGDYDDATRRGGGNDEPRWAYITAGIGAVVVGLAVPAGIAVLTGAALGVFQAEGWFRVDTGFVAVLLTPVAIVCGFLAGRATARWIMSVGRLSQMTQWIVE